MMNAARFAVGLEGLAIAERAYQKAVQYARERIQGTDIAGGKDKVAIMRHPDVRRMLMRMRAQTEAMRAVAYVVASAQDAASRHPDAGERARNQTFVDLMIPIVKGWSTETGNEVASLGVQVLAAWVSSKRREPRSFSAMPASPLFTKGRQRSKPMT